MAAKKQAENLPPEKEDGPDAHLYFRVVGPTAQFDRGIIDGGQFDFEVSSWMKADYKIKFAQATGLEPGAINVFILFVKNEPE